MSDELPVFWYMAVVDTAGMPVEPLSAKLWGDLEWTKETAECCTAAWKEEVSGEAMLLG